MSTEVIKSQPTDNQEQKDQNMIANMADQRLTQDYTSLINAPIPGVKIDLVLGNIFNWNV